jgi:hypothetical protein
MSWASEVGAPCPGDPRRTMLRCEEHDGGAMASGIDVIALRAEREELAPSHENHAALGSVEIQGKGE